MNHKLLLAALVLVTAAFAGGCATKSEKTDGSAVVEDKGISSGEMGEMDAAKASGLGDSAGFRGAELDDPSSPLSVRVFYFEYDSSEVRAEYRPAVEAHAAYLAANPSVAVTVEGHADERGSREYNLALGERRAIALRRQLVLLGASAGQIRTVSYGEERPAVPGHDEAAFSRNRRAEILY